MPLRPPPTRLTLTGLARKYLEFKHRHEVGWEVIEGIFIAIVFYLLITGRHHESEAASTVLHAAAGLLLLTKLLSVGLRAFNARFGDHVGIRE
jgi:hypothetical protein